MQDTHRLTINTPEDLANAVMKDLSCLRKEVFKAALLNVKNQLIKWQHVSEGAVDGTLVHPRETFKQAIYEAASSVILVHNHPSGDPTPSQDDIQLTRRMKKTGEIIGIEVLDHIIIGKGRFASLRQLGHFDS